MDGHDLQGDRFVKGALITGIAGQDGSYLATNETHSAREFAELAFGYLGLGWEDHVLSEEKLKADLWPAPQPLPS